jgi:hypothetical protein
MNDVALPGPLPPAFVADAAPYLGGRVSLWDTPPVLPPEAVRPAREFADRQVAELHRLVFPLLGARSPAA